MEFVRGARNGNRRYTARLSVILSLAGHLGQLTDESSPWLGLPWAASEGGYEISQVLGPLLSDYSTGVNSCIHPKGAVFTFPPFLHESYLSL